MEEGTDESVDGTGSSPFLAHGYGRYNTSNVILIQIPDESTTPLNISMVRLCVPDECRPDAYPSAGSSKLL